MNGTSKRMKVLVTGANGFVGKNLIAKLETMDTYEVLAYDIDKTEEDLAAFTKECDFVVHLAGVNRPVNVSEFYEGNTNFTEKLCTYLSKWKNKAPIFVSSSIQAELNNDYGKSKRNGEKFVEAYSKREHVPVYIYRFSNLFGKWCRPNYNSVIATWCHNIARDMDIKINDASVKLHLCYIDDVVSEIICAMEGRPHMTDGHYAVSPEYEISLGDLARTIQSFSKSRETQMVPDISTELKKKLYSTYLSYLPVDHFSYALKMHNDERGSFTEFLKTVGNGQVSVNVSKPGIIKGNHWHHTKNEKFLVVSGEGVIRFRNIYDTKIYEYKVTGDLLEVVDIPPGYTHNIENVGTGDLVTIMWANEIFDPENPDTYYLEV